MNKLNTWIKYALAVECIAILFLAIASSGFQILSLEIISVLGTLFPAVLLACWATERYWSLGVARLIQLVLVSFMTICFLTQLFGWLVISRSPASTNGMMVQFIVTFTIPLLMLASFGINVYMNISMAVSNAEVASGRRRMAYYIVMALSAGLLSASPTLLAKVFHDINAWVFLTPILLAASTYASIRLRPDTRIAQSNNQSQRKAGK